jgi:alcohol dehydrogenase/acrylyl-CoA reductase (NADPH)
MRAIVVDQHDGTVQGRLAEISETDLPPHEVLVEIAYSSLNFKDGLSISGKGKIARKLPMVAGCDLAGTVVESSLPEWKAGDKVVVNGWGLSETHWGGFAERARLKPEWLLKLPDEIDFKRAMAIGTAGYTSMLCVIALEQMGVDPGEREIVVTGAAGGVGSVAVAILANLGYRVTASTGRPSTHDYLRELGATDFVDRAELAQKGSPLQKERWAGGIDAVGGQTLATVLSQTVYGGAVAACGLAGGNDLPGSVFPFILRNVTLLGVDSVMTPMARREVAWQRLASDLPMAKLDRLTSVVPMSAVPQLASDIVDGKTQGRLVVDVRA